MNTHTHPHDLRAAAEAEAAKLCNEAARKAGWMALNWHNQAQGKASYDKQRRELLKGEIPDAVRAALTGDWLSVHEIVDRVRAAGVPATYAPVAVILCRLQLTGRVEGAVMAPARKSTRGIGVKKYRRSEQ